MKDEAVAGRWSLSRRILLVAGACAMALPGAACAAPKVQEKDVVVATPDGSAEAALFYPEAKGRWPAVLFWPDFVGLRQTFKDMGRKLAAEGFVVLVPNSFYRSMRPTEEELNPWDPKVRPTLMKYRGEVTYEATARDTRAFLAFMDAQPQTASDKKAGTIGYDLGAAYAFRAAAAMPDRIAAVGAVYGLGVATPHPDSPHLLVPQSKATYYVAMAQDDDKREPGDKVDIRTMIDKAGLKGTVEVYPANHGFANPKSERFDAAATERAFTNLVALLKSTLK